MKNEKIITFNDLQVGDTINYDLKLSENKSVNLTETVLEKNDNFVKLLCSGIANTVYSKNFFDKKISNITIY